MRQNPIKCQANRHGVYAIEWVKAHGVNVIEVTGSGHEF